jgi:hypothetical protein
MAFDDQIILFQSRGRFEASRLVFVNVITALAKQKNVDIPEDGVELLATQAVGLMQHSDHAALMQQELDAVTRVAGLAMQLVEAWWIAQVRSLMIHTIREHFQICNAENVADEIKAQVTDWSAFYENGRWPDPAEVAATLLVQHEGIQVVYSDVDGANIVMWGRFQRVEAAREAAPLGWILTSELHRASDEGAELIQS